MNIPVWLPRVVLIAAALVAWYWSQRLIGKRSFPEGRISDRILDITAPLHTYFTCHARWANALLIASSLLIDALGLFIFAHAILGPSIRPFLGLFILFVLRQGCQGVCALPCPEGMIWRHPGFPSLFVTYGVSTDLFFSGHTAIAVYGCLELGHYGGTVAAVAGIAIALFEVATVLVLRAHYTMDVFAGAVTALWVWTLAAVLAPSVDHLLTVATGALAV
jgi:PAP2 superfamily C-terminal